MKPTTKALWAGVLIGLVLPKLPGAIKKGWNYSKQTWPDNKLVKGVDKYVVKPFAKAVEEEAEELYDAAEDILSK